MRGILIVSIVFLFVQCKNEDQKKPVNYKRTAARICLCCEMMPSDLPDTLIEPYMADCLQEYGPKSMRLSKTDTDSILKRVFDCQCFMDRFNNNHIKSNFKADSMACSIFRTGQFRELTATLISDKPNTSELVFVTESHEYYISEGDTMQINSREWLDSCHFRTVVQFLNEEILVMKTGDTLYQSIIGFRNDTLTISSKIGKTTFYRQLKSVSSN